ncbi:alanine racemase C-terminal domain-containing protein [uncultured Dysosmobacter sp.]|uniref:alanine racemase C-terminal domain-containing protein n=1 Tax=uncultured Dysosmobacter sp. TaxID=2591384 RepID=UPI0026177B32|nr:alanine racemase C-terminal domain-containing protein [uncultured Dysosmobacter sp.]
MTACVSKVSRIPAGTYVGYSRVFQAEREMDIAILTIGYSDASAKRRRKHDGGLYPDPHPEISSWMQKTVQDIDWCV